MKSADPRGPACRAMEGERKRGYLHQIFTKSYPPGGRGPLPPRRKPLSCWYRLRRVETEFSCRQEPNSSDCGVSAATPGSDGLPTSLPEVSGALRGGVLSSAGPSRAAFGSLRGFRLMLFCSFHVFSVPGFPFGVSQRLPGLLRGPGAGDFE